MYLHDWADGGFFEMVMDFEDVFITKAEFEAEECPWKNFEMWQESKAKAVLALADHKYQGVEILLASYTNECYSGDAFVLFRQDGKLYEVNGSHCSCFGLEGQWKPEETTIEAIRARAVSGELGAGYIGDEVNVFRDELLAILDTTAPAPGQEGGGNG